MYSRKEPKDLKGFLRMLRRCMMGTRVRCEICGVVIPLERLKILPETRCCVKCSQTEPYSEVEALGFSDPDEQSGMNFEEFEEPDDYTSSEY